MDEIDLKNLALDQLKNREGQATYKSAWPFPHLVIDNFLPQNIVSEVYLELKSMKLNELIHYGHYNENIFGTVGTKKIPRKTMSLINTLNSKEFCKLLSKFSGFEDLVSDSTLDGGGLMFAGRGGHMNLHTDYLSHPYQKYWKRRLNLLLYFSDPWANHFQGDLFLCNKSNPSQIKKISPELNRFVLFETTKDTVHGLPEEIKAPEGTYRIVLSLWYYTNEKKVVKFSTTKYRPMLEDKSLKKLLIAIDNFLIKAYWMLKRNFGIGDKLAHHVISFFHWSKRVFSLKKF